LGSADALSAHTGEGQLHLAFSVYVFSPDRRQLLIQQRSSEKMLWPLVWANTCCSHPRVNEPSIEAGRRRLLEEMGFICDLKTGPSFVYRAEDPDGRGVEHEYDICLIGTWSGEPAPNAGEVNAWKWIDVKQLIGEMESSPGRFAPWLHRGLPLVVVDSTYRILTRT
jgi:isopentenyl-diphosphate delta-isomerase